MIEIISTIGTLDELKKISKKKYKQLGNIAWQFICHGSKSKRNNKNQLKKIPRDICKISMNGVK